MSQNHDINGRYYFEHNDIIFKKRKILLTSNLGVVMKNLLYSFIVFLGISSVFAFEPDAIVPSGSGTSDDPFQIEKLENLVWMSQETRTNMIFVMTADIDASETTNWYEGAGFKPINFWQSEFDGCGHTIYNLYINRPDEENIGLFGWLSEDTASDYFIQNINIIGFTVCGKSNVGSIGGQSHRNIIKNCYAVGSVTGENNVGGILGDGSFTAIYCDYFRGTLTGTENVGGIVGLADDCTYCMSEVNIEGRKFVGGITGYDEDALSNCYSRGIVTGKEYVGGITGCHQMRRDYNWNIKKNYLTDCFSETMVYGEKDSGAVLGIHSIQSYSLNPPTYTYTNIASCVVRSYYDATCPTVNTCGTPLYSDQISKKIYYDFDFDDVWDFNEDFQRPRLKCMKYVKASAEKGTVTVYPEKDVYFTNDFIELSATPWPGHEFKYFKINENIVTNNNCSYPVTENLSIEAFFEPNEDYDIDFDITGGGRVEVSPDQESYYWGDTITISAYPEIGYQFSNYQIDDLVITNAVFDYVITGNKTINVIFTPIDYIITKEVVGSGSITLNPQKYFYNYGDVVDITASNGTGSHFDFLIIDGETNHTQTAQLTVSGNHNIKAVFSVDLFYVSVVKTYGGDVTVSPEMDIYPYNTYVTVLATPFSGYEFKGYTGTYTNSEQYINFRVTENVNLKATFGLIKYKVNLKDSSNGKISISPYKDSYDYNDQVILTAIPNDGYKFTSFICNGRVFTENNLSLAITEDTEVEATFEPAEYTIVINDSTGGYLSLSPRKDSYSFNEVITITATPATGYEFKRVYNDSYSSTNLVSQYTVKSSTSFTAEFIQREYKCIVTPSDGGMVSIVPAQSTYHYGDVVTITAIPDSGYEFKQYSGSVSGNNKVCVVTIQDHLDIIAEFELASYTIVVNQSTGGSLSVTPNKDTYKYDEVITLTASPSSGYEFSRVYNDSFSSTNLVSQYTIKGSAWFSADFARKEYQCVVVPSEGGTVSVVPAQSTYHYGDVVTITAIPDPGYTFKQYTGSIMENNKVCVITILDHMSINAEFELASYSVVVNESSGGSLSVTPEKQAYKYNEEITLVANPSEGYELRRVYNDTYSSTNLVSKYIVKGDTWFSPDFVKREYRCVVNTSGAGTVSVTPSQTTYHYGDVLTITAIPDTGYAFKQYSGSISDSNKVCVVTIQDHLNITAEFELASYTVTLNGSSGGSLSVSPVKDKYKYNEEITLTATPSEGYELKRVYNDTYSSTNLVSKYIVKGDTWFTPDFVQREYRCIVTTSEGGTVSVTPSKTTYHYGDVITLTAVSETGYAFKEYSGSVTSKDKVCVVTVKDHLNINAEFYFDAYELVAKATEGGSISIDPEKETYHANERVKVSAASIEGYSFAGFTGTVESKDNPLEVLMNQHHDITAVFTNVEYKVVVAVSEGGKLSIEPSQDYYHFNDELSFSVETDPGWHLEEILGYYESITNTTGTLTVKSDLTLTPVFVLNEYKVSVDAVYGGEVTLSPYKNTYHYNDAIKIICKPYDSYVLERLVINGTDTEEYEFVLTDDTEILAVFGYEPVKPEGTGSKDDPYQIATVANLFWLSRNSYISPDTYSVLTSDLDISICKDWQNGKGFEPIGTLEHPYGGTFDGQGFSISGLYIDDDEAVNAGLFGYAKDAEITDLNIFDAAVRGKENCGGLVGYCYNCSIDNVYVNAQVYADINAGGLVGSANYATIQRSSSEKTVSGNENLGGILGKGTDCTVANCFTTAKMNGYDSIGGIIGSSIFSTVSYCFAAGGITANTTQGGIVGASQDSTVVSSFFDKTQARENGYGTGVTAQELYSRATFSDWDFINIWEQYDGITRPFLRGGEDSNWQKLAGASTGKISISGVLSGDDLETIKAHKTVCVYSLMDNTLLAEPVQLSGTSLKTKEVKVQYNVKKRSLKYSSTVPQLTVGAFNDEGVLQCQLNSSKKKLDCTLVFDNDVTDTIGNSQISLCDDFMNNGCLTGTKIQLTDKGKSLTYKGTVNDVTLQVNIALKTGKVSIKYSSKNKVSAVVSK